MYGLIALGQPLVDVIAKVDDDFLRTQEELHGINKGDSDVIDASRAIALYNAVSGQIETPGGSTANTAAGFASFGSRAAYIGKVGRDRLGDMVRRDMDSIGVDHYTPPHEDEPSGLCLVFVTPDGERTMSTFLGAAGRLAPEDIDEHMIANAAITYAEGYLFDHEDAKRAVLHAADIAKRNGRKVAFTLSSTSCIERHRAEFIDFAEHHADIIFANERETNSLFESTDREEIINKIISLNLIFVMTLGPRGALIVSKEGIYEIPSIPSIPVDTTGAGDQYAAGFLYGYTEGMPLPECGRLGTLAATETISHLGPRPQKSYSDFLNTGNRAFSTTPPSNPMP